LLFLSPLHTASRVLFPSGESAATGRAATLGQVFVGRFDADEHQGASF